MGPHEILVIEDDDDLREVLVRMLGLHGYVAWQARDGREALRQLRGGFRPTVILLNLCMPGMDGRAFRAAQLQDPALAGIPVVVISGELDGCEQATAIGAAGFLYKPFDMAALLTTLRRWCPAAPWASAG